MVKTLIAIHYYHNRINKLNYYKFYMSSKSNALFIYTFPKKWISVSSLNFWLFVCLFVFIAVSYFDYDHAVSYQFREVVLCKKMYFCIMMHNNTSSENFNHLDEITQEEKPHYIRNVIQHGTLSDDRLISLNKYQLFSKQSWFYLI